MHKLHHPNNWLKVCVRCFLASLLASCGSTSAQIITTIAGGYLPEQVPAATSRQTFPNRLTVGAGNYLYVLNSDTGLIQKISPLGIIGTVTGKYYGGFAGDGGPAIDATLNSPASIAADQDGNLYIADSGNHRVRRISPDGTITTVAGNGVRGSGGDGGQATAASLNSPISVSVGLGGSFYVGDRSARVRKVTSDGRITTIAGNGVEGFSDGGGIATAASITSPAAIQADDFGGLYIVEPGNNIVRRISADGRISIVAGNRIRGLSGDGGPATSASLGLPQGVAIAGDGSFFIADYDNQRIRRVSSSGTITTFSGGRDLDSSLIIGDGQPAIGAVIPYPYDVALDKRGRLYIADLQTKIRVVEPSNLIYTFAGGAFRGDWQTGISALQASLLMPNGTAVDSTGNIYFSHQLKGPGSIWRFQIISATQYCEVYKGVLRWKASRVVTRR
jgi:sugar lactone lactonase YvrE